MTDWLPIPSCPEYEASSDGDIRRALPYRSTVVGRLLTPRVINGYETVTIRARRRYVHRLVCEAFHGSAPIERPQAAHKDGNRLNNASANLGWASQAENESDKTAHGTRKTGSAVRSSKLTEYQVRCMREAYGLGLFHKAALARIFRIHPTMVKRIIDRTAWSHVQ